jgi:hypothetical protein
MNYDEAKPPSAPSHTPSYSALRLRSIDRRSVLWLLGYPDAALVDANQALRDAREIDHAATLMFALALTPHRARLSGFAAANDLIDKCKHRCDARAQLTRRGGILNGAIEKEVSNGSRHSPLPERTR